MKHILIIEDNNDVRENLSEILELSGYQTSTAANGKAGISLARNCSPDLIICDVMMPELDGYGVLKIIANDDLLKHTPFMFLTAKSEKSDFRKGMGLGADDYITKPFDDVELLQAIETRLKKNENIQDQSYTSASGVKQLYSESKANDEFNKLLEEREVRRYNRKDLIYTTHQYAKWIYYVVSGQVKCFQTNDFGKELITHLYGPGEFFGYLPLIMDTQYQDSTMATVDSDILLIPEEDFKLLVFNNHDFSAKFIKIMAGETYRSNELLLDLAYSSVRKKVANSLLLISEKTKSDSLKVMRDDLAHMAGTAKETVIRTLSDFKSEGIINIKEGSIVLVKKESLKDMPQ